MRGWPVWAVFLTLWGIALARGAATYWAGRGLRAGGARSRWSHHLERPGVERAEGFVRRVGAPAVTLGFLTVGLQSAINASAGMLRMPLRRFVPAVLLGSALWSAVYTTVGIAVVDSVLGRVPWWVLPLVLVAVVAVLVASARLRRRVTTG